MIREGQIEARTLQLQDAVERMAHAAIPDCRDRERLCAGFDGDIDDWIDEDDYFTADLDEQVLRACRLLELPEHLAEVWRDLPRPTVYPEDLTDDDAPPADADLPAIRRDTG